MLIAKHLQKQEVVTKINLQKFYTMRKILLILTIILLFLLISNFSSLFRLFFLSSLFGSSSLTTFESYTTLHGEFSAREDQIKGSTFKGVTKMQENYLRCHPKSKDFQLYRTFKMHPIEFWNWFNYFTHPRYQLPYIEKNKVLNTKRPPTICPELYPDDAIDIK